MRRCLTLEAHGLKKKKILLNALCNNSNNATIVQVTTYLGNLNWPSSAPSLPNEVINLPLTSNTCTVGMLMITCDYFHS